MTRPAIAGARLGWTFHRDLCRSGLFRSIKAAIIWGVAARQARRSRGVEFDVISSAAKRSLR